MLNVSGLFFFLSLLPAYNLRLCIGVLGAFSYLQREHRKHDIHVATLRAQSEFFETSKLKRHRVPLVELTD